MVRKLSKPSGALVTRSMQNSKPTRLIEKRKRITLTSKEISELLAEGIVTVILLLLLNVAIIVVLSAVIENSFIK